MRWRRVKWEQEARTICRDEKESLKKEKKNKRSVLMIHYFTALASINPSDLMR